MVHRPHCKGREGHTAPKQKDVVNTSKVDYFWKSVSKTDGCWEWTRGQTAHGYGRFWTGSERIGTHRFSYFITHGAIPEGKWVLHKCDNRICVRPSHLYLGTVLENNRDTIKRGRQVPAQNIASRPIKKGENHYAAKLTAAAVIAIREQRKLGRACASLAAQYGVSPSTIYRAELSINWKEVHAQSDRAAITQP